MAPMEQAMSWAVGIFEGEGCINIHRRNNHPNELTELGRMRVTLSMQMNDEDIVRRFHEVVGVGNVFHRKPRGKYSEGWQWYTGKKKHVKQVLEEFLPLLGARRSAKALEAIALIEKKVGYDK